MYQGDLSGDEVTCRELVELLTDYLEGALPAAQHARMEAHLGGCPKCAEYLAQMRLTLRLARRAGEEAPLPHDRERLMHTFRDWTKGR